MLRRTIASLSAAALTVAAVTAVAEGRDTNTATAAAADQTLTVPHPETHFVLASKQKGPSTGDTRLEAGSLVNAHGRKVGALVQSCAVYDLGKTQLFSCTGGMTLPGGQITFAKAAPENNLTTTAYAITGGTGAYQTARGTITTVFQKSGKLTVKIAVR